MPTMPQGRVCAPVGRIAADACTRTRTSLGPGSGRASHEPEDFWAGGGCPDGATAIASAFDAGNGQVLATFEAAAFGSLRTSSISALATRLLSDPGADEMTIVGSGRQSLSQVEAVAAVRDLNRVRVWSPTRNAPRLRRPPPGRARAAGHG